MSMCTDVKLNAQDCSHRLLEAPTGGRFFFKKNFFSLLTSSEDRRRGSAV